ncbi:hypothetical protein FRC03_008310 [Tulasnella sp. 419]|nr:hypothetical protein FRC03_008310 [Tulasnella sp. 419]
MPLPPNIRPSEVTRAFLVNQVGEHSRVHSDTYAKCFNCHTEGTKDRRLSKCARCQSVWYCGRECQRSHWKQHKQWCTEYTAFLATRPSEEQRLTFALKEWAFARSILIDTVALNLLLPNRERPDNLLIDTHVFVIVAGEADSQSGQLVVTVDSLSGSKSQSGQLVVIHADAVPLETLSASPYLRKGYDAIMERKDVKLDEIPEFRDVKKSDMLGIAYIAIYAGPALRIMASLITKQKVKNQRQAPFFEEWLEMLKYGTLPGSKQFITEGGGVISVGQDYNVAVREALKK